MIWLTVVVGGSLGSTVVNGGSTNKEGSALSVYGVIVDMELLL